MLLLGFRPVLDVAGLSNGAGTRIRTGDLLITNQLLYQLSYAGKGWDSSSRVAHAQSGMCANSGERIKNSWCCAS